MARQRKGGDPATQRFQATINQRRKPPVAPAAEAEVAQTAATEAPAGSKKAKAATSKPE